MKKYNIKLQLEKMNTYLNLNSGGKISNEKN